MANIPACGFTITSPGEVNLGAGTYYFVPFQDPGSILMPTWIGTDLYPNQVLQKPTFNDGVETNQEHVFEIGYISDFFDILAGADQSGCNWIGQSVIQTPIGAALLASIDNTGNMVWVDKSMNQAKSNVVNQNKQSPGDPPQSGSVVDILNFTDDNDNALIISIEFFLRNFAAVGQYFAATASTFRTTAANFQQVLSQITPSETIAYTAQSLPAMFNTWLTQTVSGYPNGCTSRATNAWNFYRDQMQEVANVVNRGVVPGCFPLYTANIYQASGFTWENLIPPPPTTAPCNVPGTLGSVGYVSGSTTVTSLPSSTLPERIMGAGNINYYGVGSGANIAGTHYQGIDMSSQGAACIGVFVVFDNNPGSGPDADVAFQCPSNGAVQAPFNFVINGQITGCAGFISGNSAGELTNILCAPNQANALNCAQFAANGESAFLLQMVWFPS